MSLSLSLSDDDSDLCFLTCSYTLGLAYRLHSSRRVFVEHLFERRKASRIPRSIPCRTLPNEIKLCMK